MTKSSKRPATTYRRQPTKNPSSANVVNALPDAANLLWAEFADNDALLENLRAAMRSQGLRSALNTLRAYPIRAGHQMDPLVFAGFVQGYHACLDTLMALASTTKPQTVEATFGADIN